MGKWLIGALLAATAWTPMAQAQDGGWRGRHGDEQQRPAEAQNRGDGRPGGGWQGRGDRGDRPQPQPQAQVGAQVQTDAGQRRYEGRGGVQAQQDGGWQGRRDWQRQQPQQRVDAAPQQGWQGRDRNGDGRRDWAGSRPEWRRASQWLRP